MLDSLVRSSFALDEKINTQSGRVHIRNGKFWACTNNETDSSKPGGVSQQSILYADLNSPEPKTTPFPGFSTILYTFVSPDGRYCFVTYFRESKQHGHTLIDSQTMNTSRISLFGTDKEKVRSVAWLTLPKSSSPYLFLGTDKGTICYVDLNNHTLTVSPFMWVDQKNKNEIYAISASYMPNRKTNDKVHISYLQKNSQSGNGIGYEITTLFVDDNFAPLEGKSSPQRRVQYHININASAIYSDPDYIGFINSPVQNQNNPTEDQMTFYQFLESGNTEYTNFSLIRQNKTHNSKESRRISFARNEEFMFYCEDHKFTIFKMKMQNGAEFSRSLGGIDLTDTFVGLVFDVQKMVLYGYSDRMISIFKFPNEMNLDLNSVIWHWLFLYHTGLIDKNINHAQKAANALLHVKLSFQDQIKLISKPIIKMNFLKELLEQIPKNKIRIRRSLALYAFSCAAEYESSLEKPRTEQFISWAKPLIHTDKLLSINTVIEILQQYGYSEAIVSLLEDQKQFLFELYLQQGRIDDALEALNQITDHDVFAKCALRLYLPQKQRVSEIVIKRSDEAKTRPNLIPILASPECAQHVSSFISNPKLFDKAPWLLYLFAIQLCRLKEIPLQKVIDFYTGPISFKDVKKAFMTRCLMAAHEYQSLAEGLKASKDYIGAAVAASKGDPQKAFDYIPESEETSMRKRSAMRILLSLSAEKRPELAKHLLSKYGGGGVEIGTLLAFLGDDVRVSELSHIMAEYVDSMKKVAAEQDQIFNEAIAGIQNAQNMIKNRKVEPKFFGSTDVCDYCQNQLLTDKCIMYPCGHHLHQSCAQELMEALAKNGDAFLEQKVQPITMDCPLCGYLSVGQIDLKFDDEVDQSWSLDMEYLQKLGENQS